MIFIFAGVLFAETIDCTKVFEERKHEIIAEIDKIDEARQSFEALQAATNSLFDKQRAQLEEQKNEIDIATKNVEAKEAKILAIFKENQRLLDEVNSATTSKVSETYNKMKESAAASILEALPVPDASAVMFTLPAKKISKIMAKMDPLAASKITLRLRMGPPFENNTTK